MANLTVSIFHLIKNDKVLLIMDERISFLSVTDILLCVIFKEMPFEIPMKCLVMIPQKTGNSDDILTKFYEIPRLLYLLKPLGVIFQWVQLLIEPHGARQGVKFIEISRTISVRDIRTTIS